jgi:cytochrome c-type biogenesis protein CcmE
MNKIRYWIGALVVVAAVGYLAVSAADQNMVTYLTIPEVKADPARTGATGVRIVGNVAEGSIETTAPREVWFEVVGEGDTLRACYRGVVPDTFKDRAEVVLEGRMNDRGEFHATTLLAKCPSKYDPETHEMRADG